MWTRQEQLAASLIEVIDGWGRNHALILGAKQSALPKPVEIRRPGEEQGPRKRPATAAEVAALFEQFH